MAPPSLAMLAIGDLTAASFRLKSLFGNPLIRLLVDFQIKWAVDSYYAGADVACEP